MELSISVNLFIEDPEKQDLELLQKVFKRDKSELLYLLHEYQLYSVLPQKDNYLVTLNNEIYQVTDIYYSISKIFYVITYEKELSKFNIIK